MKRSLGLAFCLVLFCAPAGALDFGVAAKAGTNGIGLDLGIGLTENVNLRVAVAALDLDGEDEDVEVGDDGFETDIDSELDFDYGSNALLLDWHVTGGSFRLTAGMFRNTGAADITGTLVGSTVISGQPLDPADFASDITGEVELADSYQPYIGIGWGRAAGGERGFSFSLDLGVALLDTEVDFEATVNPVGPNTLSQAELDLLLREIEADAEDELDDYEFWPVLALGVNYAF
ncbi:MAG: hypothetical protein QNJ85_05540 [Gammaproteobacteria bacterium]|nr:hypothetical protein [Gammaproteobacteria bacterium]